MSDKKMTLEQVRDWHRDRAAVYFGSGDHADAMRHRAMADAIDAEIKSRGEPIAWETFVHGEWEPTRDPEFHRKENRAVRALYTAPPAPKIEVTDAMVERAIRAFRVKHTMGLEGDENLFRAALEAALKETP